MWGSGFRANATVGRAIRLGAINGLGLKPHVFDQATQGNPAKYSCFIAENEEDSPWPSLAADNGFAPTDSAVTSTVIRSVLHIEARHTIVPEQLVADFADSLCRTGALVRPNAAGFIVLNSEHARLFDKHGWSKDDVRQAIVEPRLADVPRPRRVRQGGDRQGHRLAAARRPPGRDPAGGTATTWTPPSSSIKSIESVQIVVAGAPNAGVSSIVETFGFWDRPMAVVKVEEK